MIVRESGFEDVIFEAGVCTSGSLQGVLAGSHYNRAWNVHNIFAESLERIFLKRFLHETKVKIPDKLSEISIEPEYEKIDAGLFKLTKNFFNKYDTFREAARNGSLGKTAQFWLIYMDLMRYQIMAHTATQENNHHMLMYCWQQFIPMYFALNKLHYAR